MYVITGQSAHAVTTHLIFFTMSPPQWVGLDTINLKHIETESLKLISSLTLHYITLHSTFKNGQLFSLVQKKKPLVVNVISPIIPW